MEGELRVLLKFKFIIVRATKCSRMRKLIRGLVCSRRFPKNNFDNQPKYEVHKSSVMVFRISNLHILINAMKIPTSMIAKWVCS